jgi:hypothetical protein
MNLQVGSSSQKLSNKRSKDFLKKVDLIRKEAKQLHSNATKDMH